MGCASGTLADICVPFSTAEEVQDASIIVPQAMFWSYVLNSGMAFVMVITMLYCIGPLESILDADLPYLNLFSNTGSTGAALFLTIILILLVYSGNITALAATSREVWAFSRDRGFPFSSWISHVSLTTSWHCSMPWTIPRMKCSSHIIFHLCVC